MRIKRYRFHNCHEDFSEIYESVSPGYHQTNRLRQYLYQLCVDTTIQHVSTKQNIPYSTLERIFYSVAQEKAVEHQNVINCVSDLDDLTLSLDEISVRKEHQYETVLMDAKLGCVLGIIHKRTCESTEQLLNLRVKSPEAVKTVVVDMEATEKLTFFIP
ncbi:hypothetical protein CON64_09690 [Bacillus pseudomycoides]|nr:hypothetical protein CON64_09690 [Bacillus pseudomycoides]